MSYRPLGISVKLDLPESETPGLLGKRAIITKVLLSVAKLLGPLATTLTQGSSKKIVAKNRMDETHTIDEALPTAGADDQAASPGPIATGPTPPTQFRRAARRPLPMQGGSRAVHRARARAHRRGPARRALHASTLEHAGDGPAHRRGPEPQPDARAGLGFGGSQSTPASTSGDARCASGATLKCGGGRLDLVSSKYNSTINAKSSIAVGSYNRNGSPESSARTRPGAQPSQGQRPVSS